jgi:hypothetical protein
MGLEPIPSVEEQILSQILAVVRCCQASARVHLYSLK